MGAPWFPVLRLATVKVFCYVPSASVEDVNVCRRREGTCGSVVGLDPHRFRKSRDVGFHPEFNPGRLRVGAVLSKLFSLNSALGLGGAAKGAEFSQGGLTSYLGWLCAYA
jgi:hypothetical protein